MRTMRTMCVHGGDAIYFHTRDEREREREFRPGSSLSLLSRGIDFTVFHTTFRIVSRSVCE